MKEFWKNKKYTVLLVFLEAAGFLLFWLYGYHWLKILRYLCLIAFLTVLAAVDREKKTIPNKILAVMFFTRLFVLPGEMAAAGRYWKEPLLSAGLGLALGLIVFLLAYIASKHSIGMGDVKLCAVLGWYLGSSLIWWDMIAALSMAGIYSVIQLFRKKLTMKDSIPLAPFFCAGTILVLLLGF